MVTAGGPAVGEGDVRGSAANEEVREGALGAGGGAPLGLGPALGRFVGALYDASGRDCPLLNNNNNNKQGQYSVQRPTLGQRLTKDTIATAIHWHNAVRQITNIELPLTQLCAPRPPTKRIYHPGATLPTPSCIPDCRVRGPRPVARRAGATPAQSTRAPLGPPPSWRWYPLGPAPPLGAVALPHCWSSVPHGCPAAFPAWLCCRTPPPHRVFLITKLYD